MGNIDLQIFAERLKELRTSLNLTQVQFVEGLGITPAALSAYEKNNINPSISIAKRIAEKYNVSIDWLCGLSDKKTIEKKINTCADVINIILELYNTTNLNCDIMYQDGFKGVIIVCDNREINEFFVEWWKIKKLYDEKIINDDMYYPWLSNKLNSMNVKLSSETIGHIDQVNFMLEEFLQNC